MEDREKRFQSELISKMKIGEKDRSGRTIKKIHIAYNDFVIYEVEEKDEIDKLRYLIDCETEEKEMKLNRKIIKIKDKYVTAKGLVYRSNKHILFRHRVAHALSTILLSDDDFDSVKLFDDLIKDIESELEKEIENKISYLAVPTILILGSVFFFTSYKIEEIKDSTYLVFFASILGGYFSIATNIKKLDFKESILKRFYFLNGIERILISYVAGLIAFFLINANVIFPDLKENIYGIVIILIIAGYSESLIPSMLNKYIKKEEK